jgi:hypothetical protein
VNTIGMTSSTNVKPFIRVHLAVTTGKNIKRV